MARMLVTRNNPFPAVDREFVTLRQLMDQLIENSFVNTENWPIRVNFDTPAMDVAENNEAYTVKAELPGWKPEDVNVTVEKGTLTVSGEWKAEKKTDGDGNKRHVHEIRHASFSRSFQLPAEVETDKAQAKFENGVLTLVLPKAELVKPKQIKIPVN